MSNNGFDNRLESFTPLKEQPECGRLPQGKKLLEQVKGRLSLAARRQLSYILNGLSLPEGGRVLEIGPGCGNYAIEMCQRGFDYLGFEMVGENVEVWKMLKSQFALKGSVVLQDICSFNDNRYDSCFDGVFSIATFEHIHDQSIALKNCCRLLKPGGRIVIVDGNILDPRLVFDMTFRRPDGGLLWLFRKGKIYDDYGIGWKGKCEDVKSIFWWKKALMKNGFSVIDISTMQAFRAIFRITGIWPFFGSIMVVGENA